MSDVLIRFTFRTLIFFCLTATSAPVFPETLWIFFTKGQHRSVDDPVFSGFIVKVEQTGARLRNTSRYFNAVAVEYDGDIGELEKLACVERIEPVKTIGSVYRAPSPQYIQKSSLFSQNSEHSLKYGNSYAQLQTLNIPALHDLGYIGRNVRIGVLDTGFHIEGTGCLSNTNITHTRNFKTGGSDVTGDYHGSQVLGCMAGALDGEYYGPAFGATYFLAATDDPNTESRIEEDRWVAAVEWCDSLGADIISSSLVYNEFDTVEESYTKDEMDGKTSLVAKAAEIAFSRGILMVNSAGNEGANSWRIITTPGDAEHVLAVGAVEFLNREIPILSSFSSRGPTADGRIKPDVVAPGSFVIVPQSGTPHNYTYVNGTSFAAPLISGLCALLLEAHPEWSPTDVVEAIKQTAIDLGTSGPDNNYGWGLPDALKALNYQTVLVEETDYPRRNEDSENRPLVFELSPPFPNPFNSSTNFIFTVNLESDIKIGIYDILGRKIATVWDEYTLPGTYRTVWNAGDYASGIYFLKTSAGRYHVNDKLTYTK
ncbi:MAG: S8 family peptidase [Candidatus Latescibacteria bacterium]|nr:S8 family peptidase [Candidatus Latescibacterota bacterium]